MYATRNEACLCEGQWSLPSRTNADLNKPTAGHSCGRTSTPRTCPHGSFGTAPASFKGTTAMLAHGASLACTSAFAAAITTGLQTCGCKPVESSANRTRTLHEVVHELHSSGAHARHVEVGQEVQRHRHERPLRPWPTAEDVSVAIAGVAWPFDSRCVACQIVGRQRTALAFEVTRDFGPCKSSQQMRGRWGRGHVGHLRRVPLA
jgi:hypothetical protein